MIHRDIEDEFAYLAQQYPVVSVRGPRQAGKTTLARHLFPGYAYCSLENPDIRALAQNDARAFFSRYSWPLIIDEVQRVPQLLSYIQGIVDEVGKPGMYILTGSHQLRLAQAVSQSLAGRAALLTLMPLSIHELNQYGIHLSKEEYLHLGFLPRIHDSHMEPVRAYRNYFQTYVERDVRLLINLKQLTIFENFMRLLAGRIGQVLNLHSLSNDLGVSSTTLGEWLSVLEASYIVFRLPAYYKNLGKRIIKSPKIYFTEPGLAAFLLGIETGQQLERDPLHGNLFENMVVMEAVKTRMNQGKEPNLYFFRDNNRNEVDLIFERQRVPVPIEIKSALTLHAGFFKGLDYFKQVCTRTEPGWLIYAGTLTPHSERGQVINFQQTRQAVL